jgi:mannose-6-phosphate isomerase-like protein (cupin superfamily)
MARFYAALTVVAALTVASAVGSSGRPDAAELQAPATPATSFWTLRDAVAKGPLLLDRDGYQIFAVRRDKPGTVEHHAVDTDIVFIQEGAATLVTGGTITGSRQARPNEITGAAIQGGQEVRLEAGDVIVVPNGTPHWFKETSPSVSYYALKVRHAAPATGPGPVVHWKRAQAFQHKGALFEQKDGAGARVSALSLSRSPVPVELHERGTDIVFVIGGSGTFITDGTIADSRELRPGERTGTSIQGGIERPLSAGTALVIPQGTPHWLREINASVDFYAVRVR